MIKIINRQSLLVASLLLMIVFITSCEKDDAPGSTKIELLSFGPTGAMHGDTLRFIGNNLNKVTAIDFTGASVAQAAFISQTSELITVIVPKTAERGFVTLKTPEGDIVSKTRLNLEVLVTVSGMTAEARPGQNITISGEYLNWVTSIKFAKDKSVDSINFVSATVNQLVVTVPVDAETGPLVLYFGGTGKPPLQVETLTNLVVTLPSITSFAPVPVERGQNLTIIGTNLDLTMALLFKGSDSIKEFVSKSATQLVVKVPQKSNKGTISLVAYSKVVVESAQGVTFVGDLPDLAALRHAMYIDKLENGWQNWGWSSTADFANKENVRDGTASIKMDYTNNWAALKFAGSTVATANFTEFTFSIYGTPGTGGKKYNITPNGGTTNTITIEEGKWVEYKMTKAQLGITGNVIDVTFQNQDWTGKLFVDHVGFR